MKQFLVWFGALAALSLSAGAQAQPTTIFVMPMAGGLDQYLAVQISATNTYRVVTEAAQATLILTDHIGENLEESLKAMTAPGPAAVKDAADTFTRPPRQAITRARGTIFLVDRASHQVLWSTFEEAATSEAKVMNRAAQRIVQRMTQRMTQAAGKTAKP